MKITRGSAVDPPSGRDFASSVAVTPPATEAHGDGDDRVELSQMARLRQRLQSEIVTVPIFDARRVDDMRAQLANDTYHPAPRMVAERLLSELAADLLL